MDDPQSIISWIESNDDPVQAIAEEILKGGSDSEILRAIYESEEIQNKILRLIADDTYPWWLLELIGDYAQQWFVEKVEEIALPKSEGFARYIANLTDKECLGLEFGYFNYKRLMAQECVQDAIRQNLPNLASNFEDCQNINRIIRSDELLESDELQHDLAKFASTSLINLYPLGFMLNPGYNLGLSFPAIYLGCIDPFERSDTSLHDMKKIVAGHIQEHGWPSVRNVLFLELNYILNGDLNGVDGPLESHYEIYKSIFEIFDIEPFLGLTNPTELLLVSSPTNSMTEVKARIRKKAVSMLERQIVENGPLAFFDVDELSNLSLKKYAKRIDLLRKDEIRDLQIPIFNDQLVDLRLLSYTGLGIQIMTKLGIWRIASIEQFNKISSDFDELGYNLSTVEFDRKIVTQKLHTARRDYMMTTCIDSYLDSAVEPSSIIDGFKLMQDVEFPHTTWIVNYVLDPPNLLFGNIVSGQGLAESVIESGISTLTSFRLLEDYLKAAYRYNHLEYIRFIGEILLKHDNPEAKELGHHAIDYAYEDYD